MFRSLLRELREGSALTQAQVAERLGVPQSYVSKYESGERRLDFVETADVCEALGTDLNQFVAKFTDRLRTTWPSGRGNDGEQSK